MVQAIQKGLKLNGTHQLLVYADDVDTMGGESIHTVKKNTENIVVDGKDIGQVSRSEWRTKSQYKD